MKKALTKLFLIFLVTSEALAVDTGMLCYTVEQREKIAQAITDLKKCQLETAAKDVLIQENMLKFDKLNAGPSFWQTPEFVFGGIVVGVAVGGLVTFLVMRDK